MASLKPLLTDIGPPVQANIWNIEATLALYASGSEVPVKVSGINEIQASKRPGDSLTERHWGSVQRFESEIGPGVQGSFQVKGGTVRAALEQLQGLNVSTTDVLGTHYYGVDSRTSGALCGWLLLRGLAPDNTTEVGRVCLADIVIKDLEELISGTPGDTRTVTIPFKSDSRWIELEPTVMPTRWIELAGGSTNDIVIDEKLVKILGTAQAGRLPGDDYFFYAYTRPAASVVKYGGTAIDPTTVTPNTPAGSTTFTIPGATLAINTIIDVLGLVLESELT